MNRIIVVNDVVTETCFDDCIVYDLLEKNDFFTVNSIKLKIVKDTTLQIEYDAVVEGKLDFFIHVEDGVHLKLIESKTGVRMKTQYRYDLGEGSTVDLYKVYDCQGVREFDIVSLNGVGAKLNAYLKTIAKGEEKYDMMIYHNACSTESAIHNHGVTIEEGELTFHVTSVVPATKKRCIVNQDNRILHFNHKKSTIKPILLIDENDVVANHAAHIGLLKEDELFYLESRGISRTDAIKLLVKGFLFSKMDLEKDQLENLGLKIDQYWR